MNYGETITLAARLVWRHQHLWVLGLLLAIFPGNCRPGSSFNYQFPSGDGGSGNGGSSQSLPPGLQRFFEQDPSSWIGLAIILAVLVVILALIWFIAGLFVRSVARGGLAGSVNRLAQDLPSGFGIAWRGGWRRKGSLIGISLLLEVLPGLIVLAIILAVAAWIVLPIVASGGNRESQFGAHLVATLGIGVVAVCCFVVIAIPVFILLGVLTELSSIACVLEARSTGQALSRAWGLMRERPGPVALIWLVTVVVSWTIGILVAIPAVVVAGLVAWLILAPGTSAIIWIFVGFFAVIAIALGLAVASLSSAYTGTLWTLTFRSLTGDVLESVAPNPA